MLNWTELPENHPLKRLFRNLADRALSQTALTDRDIHHYLTNLLLRFASADSLFAIRDNTGRRVDYLIDMMKEAADAPSSQTRKRRYQHIGDYSLFILGMFPESLDRPRRSISKSYYADTGRRSYWVASQLERDHENTVVYRKMSDKFEPCVKSLNRVREYTSDPFYQYMLRQYNIT